MERLNHGDLLNVKVARGIHRYEILPNQNRLIISTGTGIAPFLYLIQKTFNHRGGLETLSVIPEKLIPKSDFPKQYHEKLPMENKKHSNMNNSLESANIHMLWGCRFKEMDFYARSWLIYFAKVFKIKVSVVFSRDSPEKRYVQHLIEEEPRKYGNLVYEKKMNSIEIFICGGSKFLPQSIEKAMVQAICKVTNIPEEQGKKKFLNLSKEGKIKCESFG